MYYKLIDTFNKTVISHHRTVEAAAKADVKLARSIRARYGSASYIPTICQEPDGDVVDGEEWLRLTNPGF
jgi:hypothetical protein